MKVYIVVGGDAEGNEVQDVYASKEEAEADVEKHNPRTPPTEWTWRTCHYHVEEHEVK